MFRICFDRWNAQNALQKIQIIQVVTLHLILISVVSFLFPGRNLRMFLTPAGWMPTVQGIPAPCPSPSPAAPWAARVLVHIPARNRVQVPVCVRVQVHVTLLSWIPAHATPLVHARARVTCPASVKAPERVTAQILHVDRAQAQDRAQRLTKPPPFLRCPTISSPKGHHWHPSLMLSAPLPLDFLLFLTYWVQCQCVQQEFCSCATTAWPISSWWNPSHRCGNGLCVGRTNRWRPGCSASSVSAQQRRTSERARRKRNAK